MLPRPHRQHGPPRLIFDAVYGTVARTRHGIAANGIPAAGGAGAADGQFCTSFPWASVLSLPSPNPITTVIDVCEGTVERFPQDHPAQWPRRQHRFQPRRGPGHG
ncbi:MAG: hypothetical protein R2873_27090 [Caldilineaceae bacterium]